MQKSSFIMPKCSFWYNLGANSVCGIAGIWSKDGWEQVPKPALKHAMQCIAHRGPDAQGSQSYAKAAFGHSRLAIIDTSDRANQPLLDPSGRYSLVFNGEIFNFREVGGRLSEKYGVQFRTQSDTEVLLYGLIHEGINLLDKLNGFFAFGFYDSVEHKLLCARDRYGIKPFYYSVQDGLLSFGSTLTAVMALSGKKEVALSSLFSYLQLSYLPDPLSMVEGIRKLAPGHALLAGPDGTENKAWYTLEHRNSPDKEQLTQDLPRKLSQLLATSVERRLLADVPVGTFLSGGLDSSVITLLAHRLRPDIPAFSIGFPDNPYFDESAKARAIARHIGVRHEVFEVRERDIENELSSILTGIDEPFADSSAVLVNILSQRARQQVKVSLSGDGADELLGGYNKHRALLRSLHGGLLNSVLRQSSPLLSLLPSSRNHALADRVRKLQRYGKGLRLDFADRYLEWASFTPASAVAKLLNPALKGCVLAPEVKDKLSALDPHNFNSVLFTDMALVLAGDMLYKVDSMSMHRGLEVRVPFLDHEVVEFVFSLPSNRKLDVRGGKKLLREAFAADFMPGAFEGPKRGFEAPLKHWLTHVLKPDVDRLFNKPHIEAQGIFDHSALQALQRKVHSANPGDAPSTLWAILVFQHWWVRQLG